MTSVAMRWQRWWFEPSAPDNLGLCRAIAFGALALRYLPADWSLWGDVSRVFWMPLPIFRVLHLPPADAPALAGLSIIWKAALACSALGLVTRASTTVAAVLGFYLLGLPHGFGKTHHFDALVVLTLVVMAVARCGDAWSLDAWWRRRRGAPPAQPGAEYTWPVRMVWVLMSLVFVAAGLSKLRHSGLGWISGSNLALTLVQGHYHIANADPVGRIGLWVAQSQWLCWLLAAGTIVIETGYPLALVSRWARWFFPPAMCALLLGIRVMMGPTFETFLIIHLFWVPWDRLLARLAARHPAAVQASGPPLVVGRSHPRPHSA